MPFATSPYPRTREIGLRLLEIIAQFASEGTDTTALDTALKGLTDDNGNTVLPNGYASTEAELQKAFELRPQIAEQTLTLYENTFKGAAIGGGGGGSGQVATLEFQSDFSNLDNFFGGPHNIPITVVTSDGGATAEEVEVFVRDLGTGTAPGTAYSTPAEPQRITIPAGTASGSTVNAQITGAGNTEIGTVVLELQNPSANAELDNETIHTVTLFNSGGGGA